MWRLVEYLLAASVVLLAFTEFFYPLLTGKRLFGSFRKRAAPAPAAGGSADLHKKVNEAREKVRDVKNVQDEVTRNFKSAEELKDEADKLLQRPRDPEPLS